MACLMVGVAGGLVLRALGSRMGKHPPGKSRNAEIHLAAWLPVLLLVGAMFAYSPETITWQLVVMTLIFPALVYAMAIGSVRRSAREEPAEPSLGRLDMDQQLADRRRARIEAYKHGKRPDRDVQGRAP